MPSVAKPQQQGDPALRGAIITTIVFYFATLLIFTSSTALQGELTVASFFRIALPMMIGDGLLEFPLFYLLRGTRGLGRMTRWGVMLVGVLLVNMAQSSWDTQLREWAGLLAPEYGSWHNAFIRAYTLNFYHSGLYVVLLAFQEAYFKVREHERELIAARDSERSAHLAALRFQLNPHFLFNTMNALSSLVVLGRTRQAELMIERLSAFLRGSLAADPMSLARLEEEFDMIDAYLDIERARFGDRLETSLLLPPDLRAACVPAFLLQPLVENAMKYAVAPARRQVTVSVCAETRDEMLVLCVADDGADDGDGAEGAEPGTGLGLANIRERLALEYGAEARLDAAPSENGFRAEIVLPLRRAVAG